MGMTARRLAAKLSAAIRGTLGPAASACDRLALLDALLLATAGVAASVRGSLGAPAAPRVASATRRGDGLAALLGEAVRALGVDADLTAAPGFEQAARALLSRSGTVPLATFGRMDEAELILAREAALPGSERRARGAHSTPPALARAIAEEALGRWAELGEAAPPRILDPTAGGGALLLAAARAWMAQVGGETSIALRREIAAQLHGVEKEAATATLARAAIALFGASSGRSAPDTRSQILTGDVLMSVEESELWPTLGDVPKGSAPAGELAGDAASSLVDGFFSAPPRERARMRAERLERWAAAVAGDAAAREALAVWGSRGRARGAVHPGLIWREPFSVALLNPPFLGGKRVATVHGEPYAAWLSSREPAVGGNADLAAHVLLATRRWLAPRSVLGLVATNSLAEGETRRAGLDELLREGFVVESAARSAPWPGVAAVSVVRATLVRGGARVAAALDGRPVAEIDGGLRPMPRRAPPAPLADSGGLAFIGCFVRGEGFVLAEEEAQELLGRDPRHAACVRPYLVGQDVLRDPAQQPRRWVIDFAERSLEEARTYPALLALVEERVRPVREALADIPTNRTHRRAWWRFANPRHDLRRALRGLDGCFVIPRVAKHLTLARAPADVVFSEQLVVLATSDLERIGALASVAHEVWAAAHASSLQAGLRYVPSRALLTFPFPAAGPRRCALGEAARALLEAQARATREKGVGLTALRDRELDPRAVDTTTRELRTLRTDLDTRALVAFGFEDLRLPAPDADQAERDDFASEVVRRLAAENDRRGKPGNTLV